MPTQIILNPNGSGGDVSPFLAIGRQLQLLGHHVAIMTNPIFQENVGQANLEFIRVGNAEDLIAIGNNPALQQQRKAGQLALKWIAETIPESVNYLLNRRLRCPTMFVGSPLSLAMRSVSERFSMPMVTLVLSPYVLRSQFASPTMPPLALGERVPRVIKRFQYWLTDRWVIDPILAKSLNPIRNELGLRPLNRILNRWCFSPDLNLGLFPEWFAPAQPDWPSGFQHVGAVHWDPQSPDPDESKRIVQWCVEQPNPPVVVLAGSAGPPSPKFYNIWMKSLKRSDRGLIILEPDRNRLPIDLPSHVRCARYLALNVLLPHVAAAIHSGSIGATLRCALAGVPQLVFPRVNDQFDNAERVVRLGLGQKLSSRELFQLTSVSAEQFLNRLLSEPKVRSTCRLFAESTCNPPNGDESQLINDQNVNAQRAATLIHEAFHR